MEPRQLGKYELVCRIGIGGMAEVFLARQKGFHKFRKLVVVKAVHPHLSSNQKFIKLLLYEARISALLKHARVVDIYDLGMEDGTYFIAMEYLPGQPLTEVIKNGLIGRKLDPLSAIRVFADVADGLHAAHNLKAHTGESIELVHRDVSPANIIVLYDGSVKLVDFGISKARGHLSENDVSEVKGKLGYAAPEQLRREKIDRRADIFSLGVVMWETLTHKRLFAGGSPKAVLDKMDGHKPPAPSMFRDGVPRDIDGICTRALALDPAQRYQTAAEFRDDLESFLRTADFHREENTIGEYMEEEFREQKAAREKLIQDAAAHTSQLELSPDQRPDTDFDEEPAGQSANADPERVFEARSLLADPASRPSPLAMALPSLAPAEDAVTQVDLDARHRPRTEHPEGEVEIPAEQTQVVRAIGTRRGSPLLRNGLLALVATCALGLAGGLVVAWTHDDDSAQPVETAGKANAGSNGAAGGDTNNMAAGLSDAAAVAMAGPADAGVPDATTTRVAVDVIVDAGASANLPDASTGVVAVAQPADAGVIAEPPADAAVSASAVVGSNTRAERRKEAAAARRAKAAERRAQKRELARARKAEELARKEQREAAEAAARRKRAEKERAEKERAEKERAAKERAAKERAAKERADRPTPEQRAARRKQARESYQAGIKLFIGGKLGPARSRFSAAIKLSPGYSLPHRGLGLVYERQGKRSRARSEFGKYLRMSPKAKDADAIRARIKRLGG